MTRINPQKLLLSKWTAVCPHQREKHFIVIELIHDEHDAVVGCLLQAVINRRAYPIDWRQLQDATSWLQGWQ